MLDQVAGTQVVDQVAELMQVLVDQVAGVQVVVNQVTGTQPQVVDYC